MEPPKFLTFQERYIRNPSITEPSYISGKVYSEPEAYSKYCQTSTMERFEKIATWCTFKPKLEK